MKRTPKSCADWIRTAWVVEMPGHVYSTQRVGNRAHRDCHWPITDTKRLASTRAPVQFALRQGKRYWLFRGDAYITDDAKLSEDDVLALANEATNRRRLQLEKAHALQAMTEQLDSSSRRKPIPQDVKIVVWQRDGGRCVECHSPEELEFDHIIPLALGGANTMRNLQLLCATCNRRKGATLG